MLSSSIQRLKDRFTVSRTGVAASTTKYIAAVSGGEESVEEAIQRSFRAGAAVVLVLGRAGTGKTTLIQRLKASSGKKQVIVAFTGIAARNAHGQTIHSFFGLPFSITDPEKLKPPRKLRDIAPHLERLIVDEISMVRADLIDAMDHLLRRSRGNNAPFGGVEVLFVGDFMQLPAFAKKKEYDTLKLAGYESPSPLAAKCLRTLSFKIIELTTVHRQQDPRFVSMLGKLRRGEDLEAVVAELNAKCADQHRRGASPMLLTCNNDTADDHNDVALLSLPGSSTLYSGLLEGDFEEDVDRLPASLSLLLKVGARVMFVRNDQSRRLVNGTLATVVELAESSVSVKLDESQDLVEVQRSLWENYRYKWNSKSGTIESEVIGTYRQLPLRLAWASTIHKVQGCTLSDVRLDLTGGTFATGQAYVAISRVKSIDGLSFVRRLETTDIKVNAQLLAILDGLSSRSNYEVKDF